LGLRIASVVAGSVLLLAPVAGGKVGLADGLQRPAKYIVVADSSDFEAKKQAYVDKARAELDEWGRKISAWSDEAKAKGSKVSDSARREMDETWAATKERWAQLKVATAEGWDKARRSYEDVSQKLADEWHKLRSSQ
jgi:hypothetical protein